MKIEKRNYSHNPWRLITDEGREVDYICPDHGYVLPVCAATKAELVEKLLKMYEESVRKIAAINDARSRMLAMVEYEPCDCGCPHKRKPANAKSVGWIQAVQQIDNALRLQNKGANGPSRSDPPEAGSSPGG